MLSAKYFVFDVLQVKKYIKMGITILKIFIWGSISLDICLEITFHGDTSNKISYRISADIPPQMRILNTVIP